MKSLETIITLVALFVTTSLFSQTLSSNGTGGGDWNDPNTWDGVNTPGSTNDVQILAGDEVIFNVDANIASLDIASGAALIIPFTDNTYTGTYDLDVLGTTTVAAGGFWEVLEGGETSSLGNTLVGANANRGHTVDFEGAITNNGTISLGATATNGSNFNTDFQNNSIGISGSGTSTFYNAEVTGGTITLTYTGTGTLNVENQFDLQDNTSMVVNTSSGTVNFGSSTTDAGAAFELEGNNTTFTLTDGTVNVDVNNGTAGQRVFQVDGTGVVLNVDGGTLNIGDLTTAGEGTVRITNVSTDFDFNVTGGTINIADNIDFQNATSYMDLNISGGSMYVGTQDLGGEGNSELLNGVFTMTGGILEFGENFDVDVLPALSGGASFSVSTNAGSNTDFVVDFGAWSLTTDFTFVADGGLDIASGSSVTVPSGVTLTVESESTTTPGEALDVIGTLTIDGGTVNVAQSVTTSVTTDIGVISDGGQIIINDGSLNIANGLIDASQLDNNDVLLQIEGNGSLTLGDASGGAGTATLTLGTSVTSQATPVNEVFLLMSGDDARMTIDTDGLATIGNNNMGSVQLAADAVTDGEEFFLTVQGGTLDIHGLMTINSGAGFQMTSGTTNIGLESSSGVNDIAMDANPTQPCVFEMTGGTLNLGDGSMTWLIGNENNNPAFNSGATGYQEVEISGGTANINGRFRLREQNGRFIFGGGATINFDPQATASLDPDQNVLDLESGIVQPGTANVNFINPHAATGTGEVMFIRDVGSTGDGITSSETSDVAVDFSNITWSFGDGSASNSSTDGFDLYLETGHTAYGNITVNNPTGTGRDVLFVNTGNTYTFNNITITAGVFDFGDNTIQESSSNTLLVDANGTLRLDTEFPSTYTTTTLNTGSIVEYNGTATITAGEPSGSTNFSQLIISGGGTVNLSSAVEVADTVFITSGTLAAGTNLTLATDAVVSIGGGAFTGTLQGSNAYGIEYTGSSRSVDPGVDAEWTGSGIKSLIVDLTSGQTLTVNNTVMTLDDLNINSGTLTDAGLSHTIAGNLTATDSYTGSGSLTLTGGSVSHTLASGNGTMTLSNLIINDANGASGDLDINITGSLTLTNGLLDLSSGTLTLSSGASLSGGSSASFVVFNGASSSGGMAQTFTGTSQTKTYPLGTGTLYTPFSMTLNSASSFGALTVLPVTGGSQFTLDGSNTLDIDYYWLVNDGNNFADVNADFSYTYDDSDVRGAEGNYIAARYDVSNPDWTTSDETTDGSDGVSSNVVTLNGVEFSDGHFTAGEEDEFAGVITTFYLITGVADHDWDNGAHWTNTSGGSTAINRTPGTNSPVIISGDDVTVDSDGQSAGSITLEASGTMIIAENAGTPTTGHSFGTVSGTGTLTLLSGDADAPTFPDENGADWSNFLSAAGGTVAYGGDGSYQIPTNGGNYHNLSISATSAANTKTLPDEDLTITGDMSVSGGFGTTVAISDATNGDISVAGNLSVASGDVLSFGSTTNRTATVTGNATITGTMDVANSGSASHSLTISGTLTSDGTFDMNTGGSTVTTTFNSASNASITGSGSVDFDRLIVNVGSSTSTSLTVDVTTFSITDQGDDASESSIDFQNGNLIISTAGTVVLSNNGNVTIPSTSALTLNSGSPTFSLESSTAGNLLLNGDLTINSGVLNVGNVTDQTTDNSIRYDGTAASITVNGATLNVGGAIRPNVSDASAALAFSLTNDGIVSLARNTSTNSDIVNNDAQRSEADFVLDNAASSFTMSGTNSILEMVRPETVDGKALSITSAVTNYSVTGGTVRVLQDAHDAFSSNATSTNNDVTIYSSIPLYNLEIGDGDYEGDFGGPDSGDATELDLQVTNNLIVNINDATSGNGNFDFHRVDQGVGSNNDEWNIIVGGNFMITDGTVSIPSNGDGGTLTLNGSGTQVITTNGQILGDIVLNSTGTVQLADALSIYGDWTYTQGTLDQNGQSITMTTPVGLQSSFIAGNASFDNLILSNTGGVTQNSGTTTITASGTLTISDDVIYDLGDNGLTIANQSGGITFSATPDATNMIRVSGTDAAAGITLTYPDATTSGFVFPVGATINATDYYLPAQIDLTAGGGAGATANLVLISSQHPQVTDAENALNLYWSVTSSGFNGSQTATHTYTYGTVNTDLVEGGDDSNFLDAINAGSPTFNWTEGSTTNVSSQVITFTDPGSDNIEGDFTAGVDAAFNPVTVYYTIRDGDWDNTLTTTTPWTNDECSAGVRNEVTGVQPGTGDPVVICAGNTVTVTTTTGLSASGVEVNGTLISQIDDVSTLNDISGTGTLAFDHTTATTPTFGTLASSFVSGGTLDYGGTMDYTLPTNTNYHNLVLTNSGTLTLPVAVTLTGDLSLTGDGATGTLVTGGFTITDDDGDGTLTIGPNTALTVDNTGAFPSGFGTTVIDASSTVTYSGGDQTIEGGVTYGNLTLTRTSGDPAAKTLNGNIVIAGDLDINRRGELACSTFNVELQGNWDMDTRNNTNFDPGTGTFTFGGSAAQTITFASGGSEAEVFYNLTINKSGGSIATSGITDITVSNDLTVTNGTFDLSSVPLVVNGNTTTSAGGTLTSSASVDLNGDLINGGTLTVPGSVTLSGDFTNTGTLTESGNTMVFDNTTASQSITGTTTFNNLTLQKATGFDVSLVNDITINGTLSLENEGNLVLSTGALTLGTSATITGNAGGSSIADFSNARMVRNDGGSSDPALIISASASSDWNGVYPLGVADGNDKYTPITIAASGGTLSSGSLSLRSVNGDGTTTDQGASASATTLNRHFHTDIAGYSAGTITLDVVFQYDDADVSGGESDFLSAYSVRGTSDGWIRPSASVTNTSPGANQFGASASFGADGATLDLTADGNLEWIPGNNDLINPRLYPFLTNCNPGPCDWNTGANWTTDATGATSVDAAIPTSNNAVTILSNASVSISSAAVANSLVVDGTLNFSNVVGNSVGEVTGTGTIEIEASGLDTYVDTGSGSTFFSKNGGTVAYNGDVAYTLPTVFTEYNNLTIGGSTQNSHDKSIGVGLTVFGDLTLGSTDLENPSDLSLELRGSFTSSGGDFNVADGTFVFSNTITANLPGDLTFGSAGSLTLDNFGEKDLTGALVIENLTINSSSGTFDANSNTISVTGNWDNQASTNLLSNPGTITFNGADAQQIDGDNTFAAVNVSTSSTVVTIGSGTQTTGSVTLASGTTLNLGTNTLRIDGTLDVDQGTFNAGSGTLVYTSTTDPETQVDAITVGTLEIDKGASTNTFDNDPATVTFTNLVLTSGEYDGPDLNVSGNLSIAAGAALDLTGITTLDINGDFSVANTLDLSGLTSMNVAGNFANNGTFSPPGTVTFDGTNAQTISGASTTNFSILEVNNTDAGSADVTLNSNVTISNYLDFQDGIIVPGSGTLTFNDNATVRYDGVAESTPSGGSNDGSSFVAGPVTKIGDDDFVFPIGTNSRYARLGIQPQSGTATDQYTGEYLFSSSSTATGTKTGDIVRVSGLEHWDLTRDNGSTSVIPTLFFDATSEVDAPWRLLVAHYTGTEWEDLGRGSTTGSTTEGTITAATAMTTFSDLTLATEKDDVNPTPVEMLYFQASVNRNQIVLEWSTATELNNDYFEIQKSLDGRNFEIIGEVQGNGTTDEVQVYHFNDPDPIPGFQYYRLRQVDFDGAFEYSDLIVIEYAPKGRLFQVGLYPNPMVGEELTIDLQTNDFSSPVKIDVIDLNGKVILNREYEVGTTNNELLLDVSNLKSGTYLIRVRQRNREIIAKRAMMKR